MDTNARNMPNLYELQLGDDEETEYDYCDDSKLRHRNGSDSRTARSLSMENMCSDDDLEKGDAGSPPRFGRSCVVRQEVPERTGREIYKPSRDPSIYHRQQSAPSPSSSSSSSSNKTPTLSPRRPVTIATSTLHVTPVPPTTLGQFKNWSVEAFEFAKQFVFEKIGRTQRTNDLELEKKVALVRETQSQFRILFELAKSLSHQYRQVVQTQKILSEVFVDLSHGNPEEGLCEQFNCNALTQRLLAKNGDALLGCLDVFLRSISTLCNTTIEDTLTTVKSLEKNRLKYDAYRSYVEKVRAAPRDHQYTLRLQEAERNFSKYQAKYGRLHHDLNIKLKFLEENKVKVCQKHLFLFHRGFLNYIAGNRQGIENVLGQFGGFSSSNPTTFLEVPLDHSYDPGSASGRSHGEKSVPARAPEERSGSSSDGRPVEPSELENRSNVRTGVASTGSGENFETQNAVGNR